MECFNRYHLSQNTIQFSAKGLKILAFPCNQFGAQEPGTDAEIAEFVKKYNFKGDLAAKIEVNGDNADPFWMWLKAQQVTKYDAL